jgi:subtilisin family serine protease
VRIEYYYGGQKRRLTAHRTHPDNSTLAAHAVVHPMVADIPLTVEPSTQTSQIEGRPTAILTSTIAVDEPPRSELTWLQERYGFRVIDEGSFGKVLLSAPQDATDPERLAAKVAAEVYERGNVRSAQPNFLRTLDCGLAVDGVGDGQWGLNNGGNPGVVGADTAAMAAWTITTGSPDIRVAVIDDGVESTHPALAGAIIAQHDFVNNTDNASPATPADSHGTACAGIIASRDRLVKGLASGASIVACRVASRGINSWIAEDFKVADGIDWCWNDAAADVLSISWSNGPPSDLLERALNRARGKGRAAKGSVVVASAGNTGGPIVFPARIDGVLAVGATNQWDQRKTQTSLDGDTGWASNVGPGLGLMAPGVRIETLDLTGRAGEDPGSVNHRFSGTSAAAPFVAAAAALILSVRDDLSEQQVRNVLQSSADSLGPTKWDPSVGDGRLNSFLALRSARKVSR